MKPPRLFVLSGALFSLAAYGVAVWGEAARNAAGLGFNERFGVGLLLEGFGKVTSTHLGGIRMEGWEYLSVSGMLAVFVAALAGMKGISKWVPAGYLAILLVMGGWMGAVMIIYLPLFFLNLALDPLPMDGEFFEDHVARYMGASVWLLFLLGWSLAGWIKWRPKWMKSSGIHRHV